MKDPLAEIAGEEERIRAVLPERGKETQLSDADVLAFIDDCEIEWRRDVAGQFVGTEKTCDSVSSPFASRLARTVEKICHRTARCASGSRVFRPRR